MNTIIKKYNLLVLVIFIVVLPVLLWSRVIISHRALYKEMISIMTILAFFQLLGQFYLNRSNKLVSYHKMGRVVKFHKIIGYLFIGILIFHPFLIVMPRYLEPGMSATDAFISLITTFKTGVVLGIISWVLMILLVLISLLRNRLGMKYRTWRTVHGVLSVVFIVLATWHAINLGRHTDVFMSAFMIVVAGGGIALYLRKLIRDLKEVGGENAKWNVAAPVFGDGRSRECAVASE